MLNPETFEKIVSDTQTFLPSDQVHPPHLERLQLLLLAIPQCVAMWDQHDQNVTKPKVYQCGAAPLEPPLFRKVIFSNL